MVQSLHKSWLLVSKITWRIWKTSETSSGKFKNLMGFCVQKYIPSAKTYTEDLSNITFNYLCVDSPNYLCHFWNHKSFFTTLLCIFLAQTLHTFHKGSPSKCKFSDFSTAQVKVYQIPHVIFQIKSQFFFKVWISFQCHEIQFFCTFLCETLYLIYLPLLALKFIFKFLISFLKPKVTFSSNFT